MTADQDQQHVVVKGGDPVDRLATWQPVQGEETKALLDRSLDDEETRSTVLRQSARILARCPRPGASGEQSRTGLVVGYVQSGKTLSFTALIALARDNGYPLIVLLAGTKKNLHGQTADRLAHDLAVERPGGMTPWQLLRNPSATTQETGSVATTVLQAADAGVPDDFKQTTVVTVMKNRTQLGKLTELIGRLPQHGVDLATTPVLVIDDEADQAGLNGAVRRDDETATYAAILELRAVLGRHAYVMYTATPQAPLLVNLADLLSPDFVNVLTPGSGYTGGRYFFEEHGGQFLQRFSPAEVAEALAPEDPPLTLQRALATYLLVRAASPRTRLTSMLVHPSHGQGLQSTYGALVRNLCAAWKGQLERGGLDREELLDDIFVPAWRDLEVSNETIPPLEDLLRTVPFYIGLTKVRVVNADTPEQSDIVWNTAPSWILVGGNKLDRGFTVEGLVVTYMPRSIGVGNIDTLQQRARFFGYKGAYAGFCRAWLSPDSADAFEHYVRHEELLRGELTRIDDEGTHLQDWTRKMLLDPGFKPTRGTVVDIPYLHGRFRGDSWESIARLASLGNGGQLNAARVGALVDRHQHEVAVVDEDERAGERRHRVLALPMSELLELLTDWKGHPEDRVLLSQLVLLLGSRLDESPSLDVDLYLMDGLQVRTRSLRADGVTVSALQQGRAPNGSYPGDKAFFQEDRLAVQVHDVSGKPGGPKWRAPGLSIRLPRSLAGGAIVEVRADPDDEDDE